MVDATYHAISMFHCNKIEDTYRLFKEKFFSQTFMLTVHELQ